MNIELTPDPDEIVQAEENTDTDPVVVAVAGTVQTREVPGVRAAYKTDQNVGTAVGVKLLSLEPRRKTATIISLDQDVWLSNTQAGAQSGASGSIRVPKLLPFTVDHMDQIWACSTAETTDISVATTFWSE